MQVETLLAFVLYFGTLLVIGFLTYRKSKDSAEFVLGGRSLPFFVAALSAHASDMSNWLFMAYPAAIFLGGGIRIWIAIGLLVGMFLNWQFVAPRIRRETERLGVVTLGGYFTARFKDPEGILRPIGALLSLLFFTVYISAGLVGIGYMFDVILGVNPMVGALIGMLVVIVYTSIGGFVSVCWIDCAQAFFLMLVLIIVPLILLSEQGSLPATAIDGASWSLWGHEGAASFIQVLMISFGWGLGYFGQTHILTKFMGLKDPKEMNKSKWTGMVWMFLCLAFATLIGVAAVNSFPQGLENPELVFVVIVEKLFTPFLAGIILCAIFAAIISTIDSQILVLVSVLAEDLYHHLLRKRASGSETLVSSRISVIIIAVISYLIAIFSGQNVLNLVFYAWSGLGSAFGAVLILALYTKRTNRFGAIFGMVFGGVVAAVWPLIDEAIPMEIPALIPGFLLNLPLIYLISILTENYAGKHLTR